MFHKCIYKLKNLLSIELFVKEELNVGHVIIL